MHASAQNCSIHHRIGYNVCKYSISRAQAHAAYWFLQICLKRDDMHYTGYAHENQRVDVRFHLFRSITADFITSFVVKRIGSEELVCRLGVRG